MGYVAIFIFVTYPRSRLNVLVSIYQDMNKTHSPYSIYWYITQRFICPYIPGHE